MINFNFKPKLDKDDFGWHQRGRIPHLDAEGFTQFVTFRLCDSLPASVVNEWRLEALEDVQFRKRVEKYLDAGAGECWLADERVAKIVQDALLFHNGRSYDLRAWVIMPNHAHVSFTLFRGVHLPVVMHSIKSFSANAANKVLGRTGQFWQHESFDRYIRDNRHYVAVVRYIEKNPVKAGLCDRPEDWPWSSAYYRAGRGDG